MNNDQQTNKPLAVFLMGPTASGKTDLAIQLRQELPLEVISVDSALIYRGMDIGTAKPGQAELALAPHRLIDIKDPAESYSAADFRHPGVHHRGHWRIWLGDRAHRLPAAAQLDAAGTADLGYRDVADPAELCPAEPGAEPAGDPDAA